MIPINRSIPPKPYFADLPPRELYTPDKWYDVGEVIKGEQKKIKILLTPNGASKRGVIYVFHKKGTDIFRVGKTDQLVKKRMEQHEDAFNNGHRDVGKGLFPKAVREDPTSWEMGILPRLRQYNNLSTEEMIAIIAHDSVEKGFNQNYGGGGGTTQSSQESSPAPLTPGRVSQTQELLFSPERYYPYDAQNKPLFSPGARDIKKAIYVVFDPETGKRYVGFTHRPIIERGGEHGRHSQRPDTDKGNTPLAIAMRERPGTHKLGILGKDLDDLPAKEVISIQRMIERGFELYNQNKGGGGSVSSSSRAEFDSSSKASRSSEEAELDVNDSKRVKSQAKVTSEKVVSLAEQAFSPLARTQVLSSPVKVPGNEVLSDENNSKVINSPLAKTAERVKPFGERLAPRARRRLDLNTPPK